LGGAGVHTTAHTPVITKLSDNINRIIRNFFLLLRLIQKREKNMPSQKPPQQCSL